MFLRGCSHDIKEPHLEARMNNAKKRIHKPNPTKYTGKGIGIAVLDTGISPVDDFLFPTKRIVAFRDFIEGKSTPYDDNGHGTHVTCFSTSNESELFVSSFSFLLFQYM